MFPKAERISEMTGNTQKAASAATQSTSSTPQPSSTLVSVLDHGALAQEIEDCVKEMSAADVPVEPSSGARLCQKLFLGECGKLRINAASGLLDDDYNAALEKVLALKDRMVNYYSASASASGGAPSGAGGAAGGAAAATVPQLKKRLREAAADPTQADGGVTAGVGGAERALKQAGSSIFELIKDKPMYVECFTPCSPSTASRSTGRGSTSGCPLTQTCDALCHTKTSSRSAAKCCKRRAWTPTSSAPTVFAKAGPGRCSTRAPPPR